MSNNDGRRHNIPAVLRSGLGSPTGMLPPSTADASADTFARTLMSLVVALVSRAGSAAMTYASHANRTTVNRQDVKRALQHQAMTFFDSVTEQEIADACSDVDRAIQGPGGMEEDVTDDDEDDEDDEEDVDDDEDDEDDVEGDVDGDVECDDVKDVPWCASVCTCETCHGMNTAYATWDEWNPEDDALRYLKQKTDDMIR